MKRLAGSFFMGIFCLLSPIFSIAEEKIIDEGSHWKTIEIAPSDTIAIKLLVEPRTGYNWKLIWYDRGLLKLIKERTENQKDSQPGDPSYQVFVMQPQQSGTSDIEFIYRRPWIKKSSDKIFSFTLRVKNL